MVRKTLLLILILTMLPLCVRASGDTLRTISQFGHRGFNNLLINDTLNGNARLDSTQMQRCVRDAVRSVGTRISMPKAVQIITTAGTFAYEIDAHFTGAEAILQVNGNTIMPIRIVEFTGFLQSFTSTGALYDTLMYEYASIHGDSLYLAPVPRKIDTLAVYYYVTGGNPTLATDTVTLPTGAYDAVEYMATSKAAAILRDWVTADYWLKKYVAEEVYLLRLYRGRKEK